MADEPAQGKGTNPKPEKEETTPMRKILPIAMALAKSVKEKAVGIMTTLGMQVPEAAKG